MRSTRSRLICAALTGTAMTAGCMAPGSTGEAAGRRDSLTLGLTAEPQTLDLTVTPVASIPQTLLGNVYEGLVRQDATGAIRPLLATGWDLSPDRRTYTFRLRQGVRFTDGRVFTADDVAFSFRRVIAPGSRHPFKSKFDPIAKVTAKDPATVEVVLKRPSNGLLLELTGPVGIIFDQAAIGSLATRPVGTGPMVFSSWRRGNAITLVRNNSYWGPKPQIRQAVFRYFSDPNALNNAMLAGDLDIITNVQAPQSLPRFRDRTRFQIVNGTTNSEVVLSFNNARGPLKDKRVRQAISQAIDRKALIKTVWAGYGTLIGSMVPPTDPWYEDLSGNLPYDPAAARRLLAAAGHAGGLTLQLKLPTLPYAAGAGQFVAGQLAQVGVTVRTSQLEFPGRWLDVVFTKHDYDMSIIAHAEPRDLGTFGDRSYYWGYGNPRMAALLAKADQGPPAGQFPALREAARTISVDAAADWLFLLPNLQVVAAGITGVPKNTVTAGYDLTPIRKS